MASTGNHSDGHEAVRGSSLRAAFGPFELDAPTRTLRRDAAPVPLQALPFDLLVYLVEHRDRVVAASELLDALWPEAHVTSASLARAVYKLRGALGDTREPRGIVATVHGRGFRFVAPLRDGRASEASDVSDLPARLPALRAVQRAGRELERAVGALGELSEANVAALGFVRLLTRELCGLVVSIAGREAPAPRAEPASYRRAEPARGARRGLRAV